MSFSKVTLFYGLWVKTWSLAFAAEAHAKIKPALLAVDLIALRRRQGQLVAEAQDSKRTARDLPEEVWEFIKQELVYEAVWDEELAALRKYRCQVCQNAAGDLDGSDNWSIDSSVVEEGPMWKRWGWPSCEWCYDGLEYVDRIRWFDYLQQEKVSLAPTPSARMSLISPSSQNAEELLAVFGLCVPDVSEWKEEPEAWNDFDELTAIALPLKATKKDHAGSAASPAISIYAAPYGDGYASFSNSKVAAFSEEILTLPSNAELRFRHLISTYRLQAVDRVKSTITAPSSLSTNTATASLQTSDDKFGKEEPRWMLWSLAEPWD